MIDFRLKYYNDADEKNGDENEKIITEMLDRLKVINFILIKCNFINDEFINDVLNKVELEAKEKIVKIFKTTDLDALEFECCEYDDEVEEDNEEDDED